MGGRGSSSGKSKSSNADIKNRLAGNKVDLDYAQMKYSEYAKAANYTNKARDGMDTWGKEVKRLQEEREQLEKQANNDTTPKSLFGKRKTEQTQSKKQDLRFSELKAAELSKMPKTGDKVKSAYIDTVKHYTGIDLAQARDTRFDKRGYFNIDIRNISKEKSLTSQEQTLEKIKQLSSSIYVNKNFDVNIQSNGVYRYAIFVSNKQTKK